MTTFGNHVHVFVHPSKKEAVRGLFRDVFRCETVAVPGGGVDVFRFPNNSSLSIEFTDRALGEEEARRGAWLEVKADDPAELKKRVLEAGIAEVPYTDKSHFYFQAPGGQVWRILSSKEA